MKTYNVHVIPKRPAVGDKGWYFEIHAKTKKQACVRARDEAFRQAAYDRLDGALLVNIVEEIPNG